jgi:alkylphosphonate utilization operon protein PhnA
MDIKVRDCNGAPLAEGDSVTLIKDLKLKGSSTVPKRGTVIKKFTSPTTRTKSRAAPTRSRATCCARSF